MLFVIRRVLSNYVFWLRDVGETFKGFRGWREGFFLFVGRLGKLCGWGWFWRVGEIVMDM